MVSVRAPAKLNLGLEILARRPDGYHEIATVFVPLRLFDTLEVEAGSARGLHLEVRGADLPADKSNLALRAAERACAEMGVAAGVDLFLLCHSADKVKALHRQIVAGVETGKVPRAAVDRSCHRIERVKRGIVPMAATLPDFKSLTESHRPLAEEMRRYGSGAD